MRSIQRVAGYAMSNHFKLRFNPLPASWAVLLVTVYLVSAFNGLFFDKIIELRPLNGLRDWFFLVSVFGFLAAVFTIFLSLFAFRWVFKPIAILLILVAAVAYYFMTHYGVVIEKTMIQNVMETDAREGLELISPHFVLYLGLAGILPALVLARLPITHRPFMADILGKLVGLIAALGVIGLIAANFYQDYASLFRNHRYVRDLIVPLNAVYSTQSYIKHLLPERNHAHVTLGVDATRRPGSSMGSKPRVLVVIVGETARADHFGLNGYSRPTNPVLEKGDFLNFSQVTSCGTTTAVSVPCMFSGQGHDDFAANEFLYRDNLLDIVQRSGVSVSWLDNNSGCKGVCDRVEQIGLESADDPRYCQDGECVDEVLIDPLKAKLATATTDMVIVLHQKGSHGPAYFRRVPAAFESFKPICRTVELQNCTRDEVVNAYDNSILYTDFFLGRVQEALQAEQDRLAVAMLYLSDHGESLGENNLYLHGLPYSLAPEAQTHVPMVAWLSEGFDHINRLNNQCLPGQTREAWSHDNLFSTVLGLMDVATEVYHPDQDVFSACRSSA
ncbi:MAG: phosphoethanolamine--lipid A transferase [Hahellaceae bacterium]|nr:phosphoethanolamine--lipid A transferase [Hahellaceae bacterium]